MADAREQVNVVFKEVPFSLSPGMHYGSHDGQGVSPQEHELTFGKQAYDVVGNQMIARRLVQEVRLPAVA